MPKTQTSKVFLSYSFEDRKWVEAFAASLSKQGLFRWFDAHAIEAGEDWRTKTQQALRTSDTLVLMLSRKSLTNPWLFFEVGAAIADHKKIVPILLGDLDASELPVALREFEPLSNVSPREAGKRVAQTVEMSRAKKPNK